MSIKETCPGCDARTTDVAAAFAADEPCPNCGLSASAAHEIMTVRGSRADDAIKAQFEELRLRADRAERDREVLENVLADIYEVLKGWERYVDRETQKDWERGQRGH